MTKILFAKDEIYDKISQGIVESINKILVEKDKVIIGLPGGRSISNILLNLKRKKINWNNIHIFMVDERLVPINDQDSNFRLINQELSDVISNENLHPFQFDKNESDFGLERYVEEINGFGGAFDIVLLSSGEDGHIGSLFPNHSSICNDSEGYILVENSPKPPKERMSISKKFLTKSKIGILLFLGDIKRGAYLKFLDERVDEIMCPTKLIKQIPESYVFTDIELDEELK